MYRLVLTGNTFSIKQELKAEGFRWNPNFRNWYKDFEAEDRAKALSTAYEANGIYGSIVEVNPEAKKYIDKEAYMVKGNKGTKILTEQLPNHVLRTVEQYRKAYAIANPATPERSKVRGEMAGYVIGLMHAGLIDDRARQLLFVYMTCPPREEA